MYQIDEKDRQILFELDRDARQSISSISKATRLSRDVVSYRIKQLESNQYINDYITIIDYSTFGYFIVREYLKLQNTTHELEEEIVKFIAAQPEIIVTYRTDGNYELAVGYLVKNMESYQECQHKILSKYRSHVVDRTMTVFTDFQHFFRNYLVRKERQDKKKMSSSSNKLQKIDDEDILLLKEVSSNARASLLELGNKLDMAATSIKYKLKRLERLGVIVAYRAIINYAKLGYEYYKVDLILEDLSIIPGLEEFIREQENIIYRDVAAGGSDFEFDCEVKGYEEFVNIIEEIRNLFPGKIRTYFYYKTLATHKYKFFPETLLSTSKE